MSTTSTHPTATDTAKTGKTGEPMQPVSGSVLADQQSPQDQIAKLLDQIGDWRNDAWDEMNSFYGDRDRFRDLIVKIGQTAKKIVDIHDVAVKEN